MLQRTILRCKRPFGHPVEKLTQKRWSSSSSSSAWTKAKDESNTNVAFYGATVAVLVFGISYASVPLYKVFCQMTGFGGTTQRADENVANSVQPLDGGKVLSCMHSSRISLFAHL